MKPHVICHMAASVDGRTLPSRWRPEGAGAGGLFEHRELGVKRLLLEGGGGANGAFLRAGLIDEISLILCPAVDGAKGAPSVFDSGAAEGQPPPIQAMALASSRVLEGGAVGLRYRLENR